MILSDCYDIDIVSPGTANAAIYLYRLISIEAF